MADCGLAKQNRGLVTWHLTREFIAARTHPPLLMHRKGPVQQLDGFNYPLEFTVVVYALSTRTR